VVTFIKVIVIEGNSTKEIEKPTKILLNSSNIHLLYAEQLVTNHWEIDDRLKQFNESIKSQTIFRLSLKKIYKKNE
jgi:hypothetical protein